MIWQPCNFLPQAYSAQELVSSRGCLVMKKKLQLSKERLRSLSHNQLLQIAGGSATDGLTTLNIVSERCNALLV
jgi:hypothetical protein